MNRLRDIRRQQRATVHREMAVPAVYIPVPNATPVPCTVRPWRKADGTTVGKLPGMAGAATGAEPEDQLRFLLAEFTAPLRRDAIVSVEPGEAYRLDHSYPAELGYQTWRVIILPVAETTGLPTP